MRKEKKRKTESWLNQETPTKNTYTTDPRIPLKPQGQFLYQSQFLIVMACDQEYHSSVV